MSILNTIVANKLKQVALNKSITSLKQLETQVNFTKNTTSLAAQLQQGKAGIIAEFKRKSPSKSNINLTANVADVAAGYDTAGAKGMSVLTDTTFFGGSHADLQTAKAHCSIPVLRKDFIIDEYQIIEAKALGADVILLIAAILTKAQIKQFSQLAKQLQLDVLLEVHNLEELQKAMMPSLDIIGVNNRNLKTFEVSLDTSKQLSEHIPNTFVKISESGISNVSAVNELQQYGYRGFLIGEHFMKTTHPGKAAADFINGIF